MKCNQGFLVLGIMCGLLSANLGAATLVRATYDTDSYGFAGTNNEFDAGISLSEDFSSGVAESNNSHVNFAVVKFDDLGGMTTQASSGGAKFLKLSVNQLPGPATIGVSAARQDIESDTDGYPSGFFAGNPQGNEIDRLNWFHANIKGDDAAFGGYVGGAAHLGVIEATTVADYFLDITTTVDAWLDGQLPNNGLGLWGVSVPGGMGNTFDFVSSDSPSGLGPQLVSVVPEPAGLVMSTLALTTLSLWRRRSAC
jgi:hypothetical protein